MEIMGSYNIHPNLYVLFVGPAAVARKSTTAGYVEGLLNELNSRIDKGALNRVYLGPTSGSDSKIVEMMSGIPGGAMTIIAGEFGSFVKVSPEGMYDLLSDIFDNKTVFHHATRQHGNEYIKNPCLAFLGCTTPAWIAEHPGYITGGGLASRIIFVYEDKARQHRMYYRDLDWEHFELLESALIHDMQIISEIEGDFTLENVDLMDFMEDWYQTHMEKDWEGSMEGYAGRKPLHVHKVAGLLSLCERDDLVVTQTHFDTAIAMMDALESRMPRALVVAGRNPYASVLYELLDFIKAHGPVLKSILVRRFMSEMTESVISENLDTLFVGDLIEKTKDSDGRMIYTAK